MSSEKQIIANRQNALLAGVKTEQGKLTVRHNAFKHGITAKTLLSPMKEHSETLEQYESILAGYSETLCPRNALEQSLIESMAKATFKLYRADALEKKALTHGDPFFLETQLLPNDDLDLVLRYKYSLEAQFYRALESFYRSRQYLQMDLFGKKEGF